MRHIGRLLAAALPLALFAPGVGPRAGRALAHPSSDQAPTMASLGIHGKQGRLAKRTRRARPRSAPAVPWIVDGRPNVMSRGALVLDLETGEEIFARAPDEPRAIASISKLAAALAVMSAGIDLDGTTRITAVDRQVAAGGARSRLLEGYVLSNRDLLFAALLASDNRAVSALGRAVGLDAQALAARMTAEARALGLTQTRFVEPTGLSHANVSTPREVIALLRAVMNHPVLGPITSTLEHESRPLGRPAIRYANTHRPANRANTRVFGGKTGFNDAARYCLVVAAEVGERAVAMAFLGAEGKLTRFADVGRVADWVVFQERVVHLVASPGPARASLD